MRYIVGTKYRECSIKVSVQATKDCVVYLEAHDMSLPNTYYTKRYREFKEGEKQDFVIQMPICGKNTIVEVFDNPNNKDASPSCFNILSVKRMGLPRQMDVSRMRDSDVRHFVRFAQRFAFNAGVLAAEEVYQSDDKKFKILYSSLIQGKNSEEQLTPARINKFTKVIEVSKAKFVPMTVPGRLCILFHEFSHLFMNEDMTDELEADLNGLTIYLGLGYPRIEAHEVFIGTFYQAPNETNMDRYLHIKNFIDKFEELNFPHL